jgi:hypothetical protein
VSPSPKSRGRDKRGRKQGQERADPNAERRTHRYRLWRVLLLSLLGWIVLMALFYGVPWQWR